ADFTNKECRIDHKSEDNDNKEDDSKNQQSHFAPVKYDPTDIQGYRQSDKACSQRDEKRDRFSTASYTHALYCKDLAVEAPHRPCAPTLRWGRRSMSHSLELSGF